jgi:hypothetical protein
VTGRAASAYRCGGEAAFRAMGGGARRFRGRVVGGLVGFWAAVITAGGRGDLLVVVVVAGGGVSRSRR